ncbi:MAG: HDIG domain-containing protein [Chloroflexi bacterium]|nr:HDIG domain-containing protein [Chloroflexota bacterium]
MTTYAEGTSLLRRSRTAEKRLHLWNLVFTLLIGLFLVSTISIALLFPAGNLEYDLQIGDVSPRNVLAPRRITYSSKILTDEVRQRASQAVETAYDPPDLRVARQQQVESRQTLDYIEAIRADPYASTTRKIELIKAVPPISTVPDKIFQHILALSDAAWQVARNEMQFIVSQAMRQEIRNGEESKARRALLSMVNPSLTDEQAEFVVTLGTRFVVPNTFENPARTEQLRQEARAAIEPRSRTIEQGEAIVRAGSVVRPIDREAMEQLGLVTSSNPRSTVLGTVLMVIILVVIFGFYMLRVQPVLWENQRYTLLVALLIAMFTVGARLMVPGYTLRPYLLPIAAVPMLLTVVLGPGIGLAATGLLALIIGILSGGSMELVTLVVAGGIVATLSLWHADRLNDFMWAGVHITLVTLAVIFAFRLQAQDYDSFGLIQLVVSGLLNGAAATALSLAGFFTMGPLFGITTPLQLLDLARPNHPLLRQLQMTAPGTYHHSLMISNLSEAAAQRIGADALLVRVAAYYHDIGKTLRPYFFAENQVDGVNVHERLDPKTSAQIVISHVTDGFLLGRKYHLPQKITDFIVQHHGTTLTHYFYQQALNSTNGQPVKEEDFRYPGPKPQTREAAIMMLADGVEAAVRSAKPTTVETIREIVEKIVNKRVTQGQLDECDLTLHDLSQIRDTFVQVLQGVYHPRIQYPEERQQIEDHRELDGRELGGSLEPARGRPLLPDRREFPQEVPAESSAGGANPLSIG